MEKKIENPSSDTAASAFVVAKEMKKMSPPVNDCCAICFGDFAVPCRTDCDHWFCANCILEFWRYGATLKPCKCPFCQRRITKLSPEASLLSSKDVDVVNVLKTVDKYNSLYAGGATSFIMKLHALPSLTKRFILDMSDPALHEYYSSLARAFALFLSIVYLVCSFDFLPIGYESTPRFFELCAVIFMCLVRCYWWFHRYWLRRRARNLPDAFPQ